MSVTPEPSFTEWHNIDVPPVPPEAYTDRPPRSRDELIADHLAAAFGNRGEGYSGAAALALELIHAAMDRIDGMPGEEPIAREVFSAALLAVLVQGQR